MIVDELIDAAEEKLLDFDLETFVDAVVPME